MDAYWLITWTTHGTWLPGGARGSTIRVPDGRGRRTFKQLHGASSRARALVRSSRRLLNRDPVRLTHAQAALVLAQVRSQATFRRWELVGSAVMANHVHAVVAIGSGEDPAAVLRAFKSYASRALNRRYPRPPAGTWWTRSGSTRRLRTEPNVIAAARYVRDQEYPLAMWLAESVRA